ncbi:MAG TPA: tol-pal system protein YbgF [Legionella sp.]|nr:tol-pal system protein YbgF [Legionella sp.]
MIKCKSSIIAAIVTVMLPLTLWAAAPVVDDSENFAIVDEQQAQSPAFNPKYDEPLIENAEIDGSQNDNYSQNDDGPALVKDEPVSESQSEINDNAKLIDKVQNLQQEIQELRGQLEVQAHDLKLLQQQQVAFYKDLDARLGGSSSNSAQLKPSTEMTLGSTASPTPTVTKSTAPVKVVKNTTAAPIIPVSRVNPADEQISYLAAYELVKNKQYDDAIKAMQIFVQKYPKGGYTANGEYWLGELYMVKKDYPQAIQHFEIVLQKFPSSSKAAASMLKVGYAYAATGDNSEAKRRLLQVVKNYPGTPTAKLANVKLESISAL